MIVDCGEAFQPGICINSDTASYPQLLEAMVSIFENGLEQNNEAARQKALSLAALCVGGMILARTLPSSDLAKEVQAVARVTVDQITQ